MIKPVNTETNTVSSNGQDKPNFYTIAVGASAGGLEALKHFFDHVPANCPHSFVVIQHLSPDHKSLMAELLAKNTDLTIHQAENNMLVEGGCIYLIPPKKNMTIQRGRFILTDKPSGLNLPIDIFFRSLAEDQGEKAIGIILTGTGSDGSRGMRDIKGADGMVMVQSPEQAPFDGMPLNAIRTGLVDIIAPVEQLPDELINYIDHPLTNGSTYKSIEQDEDTLGRILNYVRNITELDFSLYKRPTLVRRLERRLSINKCASPKDYLAFISENPQEAEILRREFLIGVTKFFRDPEVWQTLGEKILPELIQTKASDGQPLRVWSVACSTGEEVYSIAALLKEEMVRQSTQVDVKIFATDIRKSCLDIASKGIYPASIVADVSLERLSKYFIYYGDDYKVTEALRKMIIFSQHNVLRDPPFKNIDLVVCRNMLIYLQPQAQSKVMAVLQYALNLNGTLLLGPSETVGEHQNVLKEIDRKAKLYHNLQLARNVNLQTLNNPGSQQIQSKINEFGHRKSHNRLADIMNEALADELGLGSVYVDEQFTILHAVGEVRRFLEQPKTGFSVNLLKMLPNNVAAAIRTVARKAQQQNSKVLAKNVKLARDNQVLVMNVLAQPIQIVIGSDSPCLLIVFMPQMIDEGTTVVEVESSESNDQRVAELEEELKDSQENLQTTIEELETTNEELQAINEEMLAANEELQSTNEELQSLNEELHTVNAEHEQKNAELAALNADTDNLLKSTQIGTIFLDSDLRIRKFTPAIREQFNLREADVGRPIDNFSTHIGNDTILQDAESVILTQNSFQKEVQTKKGRWFLEQVNPFYDSEGTANGVVISFVDIQAVKQAEEALKASQHELLEVTNRFRISTQAAKVGVWDWDVETNTLVWDDTMYELYGITSDTFSGAFEAWMDGLHPEDLERGNKEVDLALKGEKRFDTDFRVVWPDQSIHHIRAVAKVERDANGAAIRMLGTNWDITREKEATKREKRRLRQLEIKNKELEQFAYVASHDLQEPLRTLVSFADRLKKDYQTELDEKADMYLKFISQSASRMRGLIKGLLEYSRINRDGERTIIDCEALVKAILEDLGTNISETNASFEIGELPHLKGYEAEVRILLQNLITNALKFHRENIVPRIAISAQQENGHWKFAVHDNGIGIATEHQERIFQIFQRLHNREEYDGTGIGLANCQKIVDLHDGRIWVESQPDQGSIFYFTIPI